MTLVLCSMMLSVKVLDASVLLELLKTKALKGAKKDLAVEVSHLIKLPACKNNIAFLKITKLFYYIYFVASHKNNILLFCFHLNLKMTFKRSFMNPVDLFN